MSKKKKILVILGGISKERAISIDTGLSCIKALKKLNYRIIKFDPKFAPITDIKKKKQILSSMLFMEKVGKMEQFKVFLNT